MDCPWGPWSFGSQGFVSGVFGTAFTDNWLSGPLFEPASELGFPREWGSFCSGLRITGTGLSGARPFFWRGLSGADDTFWTEFEPSSPG